MRILDRYVIWTFVKNYLISFMVLVGMYVVLDMLFNFDELVDVKGTASGPAVLDVLRMLRGIGDYYFYQTFFFFVHLSGVIPIVAAAFTFIRLSRFNELTAFLAAGVPLLRIALPVIVAAVILNGLLLVDQEVVIPQISDHLIRRRDQMHISQAVNFPILGLQDGDGNLLVAARYTVPTSLTPARMEYISVIFRDDNYDAVAQAYADSAVWDARLRGWRMEGGLLETGLSPDSPPTPPKPYPVYQSNITPTEVALYKRGDFVELLSTEQINQLLSRPKSYGALDLLRVKHFRFTQPLINITMLLLAIPFVLTRDPTRLKTTLLVCAALVGGVMASVFVCQQLAGHPPQGALGESWPALMAWAPVILFGPVAVVLLERMKT